MDPRRAPPVAPPSGPAQRDVRAAPGGGLGYKGRQVMGGGFSGSISSPAPPPPPEEKKEEEPTAENSAVPSRTIDVYWQSYPQETIWVRKNRRESYKETKSRMPVVLRNLAPDTAFDPRIMWDKEKERVAEAKADAAAAATAAKEDKKKKKDAKPKKLSKKEEMIEKNKRDSEDKDVKADLEKLENASKACRKKDQLGATIMATKCATALGKLRQLLMVLDAELGNDSRPATLDVLWAVEANPLYHAALAEADDGDDDEKDKKKKKDDKKAKDKKGEDKKKKEAPKSPGAALVHEFRKELRAAKKVRKELAGALASFQLEEMYNRLPPLSPFLKSWRLDAWQKKVLRHIDAGKSAVVCAPTSSGKTVISTYTCVANDRVLFVVPTEPLVWQVAAMFEKLLAGASQVALATNQLAYRPSEDKSRIVVGTPLALESSLVKIRGQVGDEATSKRWDYAQLDGGFDFDYAVFDEVHALDGDEGAALQRLVRSVTCPTLALSATIGNAAQLQGWWQGVRDDCALVDGVECADRVELVEHSGRFINVQNLVLDPAAKLDRLHPCAALTTDQLLGDEKIAFAMTPADSQQLYGKLVAEYGAAVEDLEPKAFFERLAAGEEQERLAARAAFVKRGGAPPPELAGDAGKAAASARARITLDHAKAYELALKQRLYDEAAKNAPKLGGVLDGFVPGHLKKLESAAVGENGRSFSMLNVATQMRAKLLFPALAFHLDSFRCLALFKSLLIELEEAQDLRYPEYGDELKKKAEEKAKENEARAKNAARNAKEAEEEAKEGFDDGGETFVDVSAPHPEFVLAPPTTRLSAKEIDDILDELKRDTQGREALPANHILVRALRRGFAIYIDDAAFAVYRRVVQRLAQQGKLAIVFSDVSLAYGVNMPFRTVMFCGDEGSLLTPLLAQQMAGRAGRRGLDTQGNLVYLGMSWPRIRKLMVGTVPAILGKPPHFPTMALPLALSAECSPVALCANVDRKCLLRLSAASLSEFNDGTKRTALDAAKRVDAALEALKVLGLWIHKADGGEDDGGGDSMHDDVRPKLCMVWELRDYLPESVALAYAMPLLMAEFVKNRFNFKRASEDAGSEAVQIEFFSVFLHIVDRVRCKKGAVPLDEGTWMKKDPERTKKWAKWEKILEESQARLDGLTSLRDDERDALKLAVAPGEPLDAHIFEIAKDRRMPPTDKLSSLDRHKLKQRIWHVGNILMKMHNCLQLRGEFIALSPLLRKCCQRIKYILSDDINANVDENAILAVHESDDDDDAAPPPDDDADTVPPADN
jgi:hypothetical protein